ncbi:MAG: MarR family transcriptional regulator [Filomicrobium sp.]
MQNDEDQIDLLLLDNQLCFALYAATRALTKAYTERLSRLGLTYPQYLVLLVLWEKDGQTVGEIGQRLMLDSGTLTPMLKRLEAMEIVERLRDKKDERVVYICLQPKGKDLKEPVRAIREQIGCDLDIPQPKKFLIRQDLLDVVDILEKAKKRRTEEANDAPFKA